jgi:hypothetical protein
VAGTIRIGNSGKFNLKDGGNSDYYVVGTGDETSASWITLDIRTVSGTGTLTVVSRSALKAAADDAVPFLAVMYRPMNLNGVATSGATLVATGITTDSIITVPASGQQIALLMAGATTGSFNVYVAPTAGQGF